MQDELEPFVSTVAAGNDVGPPPPPPGGPPPLPEQAELERGWAVAGIVPTTQCFHMEVERSFACIKCGAVTRTVEMLRELSVTLEQVCVSVYMCVCVCVCACVCVCPLEPD